MSVRVNRPNHSLEPLERFGKSRKEFDPVVCGRRPQAEGAGSTRVHWSDHETREAHLSFKEAGWRFVFRISGW